MSLLYYLVYQILLFSGALPPEAVSLPLQFTWHSPGLHSQLPSQDLLSLLSQVELRFPGYHFMLFVGLLSHFVGV